MSVSGADLVIYNSLNTPVNDTSTAGGNIDASMRATFDDPTSAVTISFVSTSVSDTQSVAVTGRNTAGDIASETVSLDGTTTVATSNTYERILTCALSSSSVGVVTASGTSVNKLTDIPTGETGFRRPFYDATSEVSSSKNLYEKVFIKNNNSINTLNNATLVEVSSGLYASIEFGIEDNKQSPQTISNRTTVPTGIGGGFGSSPSGLVGNQLTAADYQGVWLKLSLSAGEAANNSYYQVQVSGTTA